MVKYFRSSVNPLTLRLKSNFPPDIYLVPIQLVIQVNYKIKWSGAFRFVLCVIWSFSNRNILFFYFFFSVEQGCSLHTSWGMTFYFIIITSMLYFVFAFHFCNRPPLPLTLNRFTKCCLTFFQEPGNTVVCRTPNFYCILYVCMLLYLF